MGIPSWDEDEDAWAVQLHLELPELKPSDAIPPKTAWYLLIDDTYPQGKVCVHPAEEGGIKGTFPHQLNNQTQDKPWTKGEVCVARTGWTLNQRGLETSPGGDKEKLRWTIERLVEWIRKAVAGTLFEEGDPYELPPYPSQPSEEIRQIVFDERVSDLESWEEKVPHAGHFDAKPLDSNSSILAVTRFRGHKEEVFSEMGWGSQVARSDYEAQEGIWILIPETPAKRSWAPPETWAELVKAVEKQGVDLVDKISLVIDNLSDDKRHPLLLGFPIPDSYGQPADRLHWQGLLLPKISSIEENTRGFRKPAAIRKKLKSSATIDWIESVNWAPDQLQTRGAFSLSLREARILLLGAGSLGSHVASQLVRGGVTDMDIFDPDKAEGGNLSRHVLGLDAVDQNKAKALADQLNATNPHATIDGFDSNFPPSDDDQIDLVREADLILDCTGSDSASAAMARFPWLDRHLFVSASMGVSGDRLYFFSYDGGTFPNDVFQKRLEPWIADGRDRWGGRSFAWEGVGCWHPVSVVREDQVALWASQVCQLLDDRIQRYAPTGRLDVLESGGHHGHHVGEGTRQEEDALRWKSKNGAISVLIHPSALSALASLCRETKGSEIGGILLGRYVEDRNSALITEVGDPPPDSIRSPMSFNRGTEGVNEWLREQYQDHGRIYLGEWHFHPNDSPAPSPRDIETMNDIANNPDYSCPEPLLLVMGEPLDEPWVGVVFRDEAQPVKLKPSDPTSIGGVSDLN